MEIETKNLRKEEWRPVPGYEGHYEVSNWGAVKSIERMCVRSVDTSHNTRIFHQKGGILRPGLMTSGYLFVNLSLNGKHKSIGVHRLVALAFVPNPDNKPEVNHKNGDKIQNFAGNLEWCTQSENMFHAYQIGLSSHKRTFTHESKQRLIKGTNNGIHSNRNKTHCPQGHPYSEENTRRPPSGGRKCAICTRATSKRYYHKKTTALTFS